MSQRRPLLAFGHVVYVAGLSGIGLLDIRFADFAMFWQPVPAGLPGRAALAVISGVILLASAIGTLIPRTVRPAGCILAGFVFLWMVSLDGSRVACHPLDLALWLGLGERTLLAMAAWLWLSQVLGKGERALRAGNIILGLGLIPIGLSHFKFVSGTAGMVPGWIPAHVAFAYLTGAGHIAAGIAILFRVIPRIAAAAEAAMISAFVLLLHLPGVIQSPDSRLQWTMLCIATAMAGAAWIAAASQS